MLKIIHKSLALYSCFIIYLQCQIELFAHSDNNIHSINSQNSNQQIKKHEKLPN